MTFGSEAAFATGPGKEKHNEGKALKALQVQLIRKIVEGSFYSTDQKLSAYEKTYQSHYIECKIGFTSQYSFASILKGGEQGTLTKGR